MAAGLADKGIGVGGPDFFKQSFRMDELRHESGCEVVPI
jgi:hypothetical protein